MIAQGTLSGFSTEGNDTLSVAVNGLTKGMEDPVSGNKSLSRALPSILKSLTLDGDYDFDEEEGITAASTNRGYAEGARLLSDPKVREAILSGEVKVSNKTMQNAAQMYSTYYQTELSKGISAAMASEIGGIPSTELFEPKLQSGRISISLTPKGEELARSSQPIGRVGRVAAQANRRNSEILNKLKSFQKVAGSLNATAMALSTLNKDKDLNKYTTQVYESVFGGFNANSEQADN